MNEHERYTFDLNGYITVPGALTPEQVSALNRAIDEHIETLADPRQPFINFSSPLNWRGPMTALIDNPRIVPYLEGLFGPPPYTKSPGPFFRLDHTYIMVIGPGAKDAGAPTLHGGGTPYDPGQYYHVRENQMYNGLAVVAYNLTDVNPGDGGFGCIPGSHKANFRMPKDWTDLRRPNPLVKAVTGPAGTAVLFTEALSHGTLPWTAKHERRTLFFKYDAYCTAFGSNYLDEESGGWSELTERQRTILEAPNSRGQGRKRAQLQLH